MVAAKIKAKTCVLINNTSHSRHSVHCFYSITTFIEKCLRLYSRESPDQEFYSVHDNKQ